MKCWLPLTLIAVFAFTSCFYAPMRVPTRVVGSTAEHKSLDYSFLKAGETTAEEVHSKLGWIDTKVGGEHFYWGRWSRSAWGYIFVVGAGYQAMGNAGRLWSNQNLVVEFDERGRVKAWREMEDHELLVSLLPLAKADRAKFSDQLKVDAYGSSLTLIDSPTMIEVVTTGNMRRILPKEELRTLKASSISSNGPQLGFEIHFDYKNKSQRWEMRGDAPHLYWLLRAMSGSLREDQLISKKTRQK